MYDHKSNYILHLADNVLILAQQLGKWCGHGPILEQDIALTNISLDLIGQSRYYYQYAAELIGGGESEDSLAMCRPEHAYLNFQLVEQSNGDWAHTIVRQFLFDTWHYAFLQELKQSNDTRIADIATRSIKEVAYHRTWSTEWICRLAEGTDESRNRLDIAWRWMSAYDAELFQCHALDQEAILEGYGIDPEKIFPMVDQYRKEVYLRSTYPFAPSPTKHHGGKSGRHTEAMGYILTDLQYMQRVYPGMEW